MKLYIYSIVVSLTSWCSFWFVIVFLGQQDIKPGHVGPTHEGVCCRSRTQTNLYTREEGPESGDSPLHP